MAEQAHTPGPWRINPRAATRIVAGDDDTIATAACQSNLLEQHAANARLIAAAPDMLAALKELLFVAEQSPCAPIEPGMECEAEELCGHPDCADIGCIILKIAEARAAIAKAEGRS